MKLSKSVKPISYLKSNAAEILRDFERGKETLLVVTQNGEARAVFQDIAEYERTQESLTLLKILAQSTASLQKGLSRPAKQVFAGLRRELKNQQK